MEIPVDAIVRVNLAWYSWEELKSNVKSIKNEIFLDWPSGRTKPPTNVHNISDIENLTLENKNIKYLGISNANHPNDVSPFLGLPLQIVPKIESIRSIENVEDIFNILPYANKLIMLDHEDLYNDLLNNNVSPDKLYDVYVDMLKKACEVGSVKMLRTTGIIFND